MSTMHVLMNVLACRISKVDFGYAKVQTTFLGIAHIGIFKGHIAFRSKGKILYKLVFVPKGLEDFMPLCT